jgi:hypothetical protein
MSKRLEMKCRRCGANENRIHGFCSMECETAWEYEDEIRDLTTRIAELEGENKKAFDFVKTLRTYCIYAHWDNPDTEGEFNEFDAEICKWLSEFTERER